MDPICAACKTVPKLTSAKLFFVLYHNFLATVGGLPVIIDASGFKDCALITAL